MTSILQNIIQEIGVIDISRVGKQPVTTNVEKDVMEIMQMMVGTMVRMT